MSTIQSRQHRQSTGATLALTLAVASFAFGLLGAVVALFEELSFGTEASLTITPLVAIPAVAGVLGVVFFAPVGIVLLAS